MVSKDSLRPKVRKRILTKRNSKIHNGNVDSSPHGMSNISPFDIISNLYHHGDNINEDLASYWTYKQTLSQIKQRPKPAICSYSPSKLKKVLNVIGILSVLIGCVYQSCFFLSLYLVYPTIVEISEQNVALLDFPAVTLCNSNPVRYKSWCEEDPSICKRLPNESLEAIRKRHANRYDTLSRERRIELGTKFSDFLIYAEYEEEEVTEKFTWYYDYEFTNCYTFNALWGNMSKGVRTAIVFNPVTGKSSELIMCVNIDISNYSNLTDDIVGRVKMTIHANDIVPNPSYDAASLEAGEFYSYGIKKVTTELLKSPYQTNCRNYEDEKEVRTGARMSQKNCLLECFKTETENMCGCTYRRLALMYNATPCDYNSQNHCLTVVEEEVFNLCNPQCPMACKKIEFKYTVADSDPLRKEDPLYEKMGIEKYFDSKEQMRKNMACFRIHYGSTETRTLSYRAKYEFIELFSLLGGYSGLWLGFSLLNCYEFVLFHVIHFSLRRKTNSKRKVKKIQKRKF